jgi:hypothetical protein
MVSLEELEWVGGYNAYERLAGDSNGLYDHVLRPAIDEYQRTGRVPAWCGVDLLRGWAFYLHRADYFQGGGSLGREWIDVLEALRKHPAARGTDRPPEQQSR